MMTNTTQSPERTIDDMAQTSPSKPHLLTLPGELKNRIYRLTVVSNGAIAIASTPPQFWKKPCVATITAIPALMRVCKQLRKEVHAIYSKKTPSTS